jgi:hypothetical protein
MDGAAAPVLIRCREGGREGGREGEREREREGGERESKRERDLLLEFFHLNLLLGLCAHIVIHTREVANC